MLKNQENQFTANFSFETIKASSSPTAGILAPGLATLRSYFFPQKQNHAFLITMKYMVLYTNYLL